MSGSLFDVVGPVMVGPSSSHTAGAVRLAYLARLIAGKPVESVAFVLYNSFAQTYKGHGTDKGLLAGILGYAVADERIRDAFELANAANLKYRFIPNTDPNHYSPNTVIFNMALAGGETMTLVGHSIGGGKVYMSKLNDYNISLKGDAPTVILFYKDQPGMISRVSGIIAEAGVNIASLNCSRLRRGVEAFMSICLDEPLADDVVQKIYDMTDVHMARCMDKLAQ